MDDDKTQDLPDLKASDFQNTLEGELPGNVAAEHGNLAGAAPNAVTLGRTVDDVERADPGQLEADREATGAKVAEQAEAERARQLREYEAGAKDGKGD